jgi:hypothetical protein
MVIASDLLKAPHIGVRELREHLSQKLNSNKTLIVTDHGQPKKVIISYENMLELVDIVDELQDRETLKTVLEGKAVISDKSKGIPVSKLFQKLRLKIQPKRK